MPLQKIELNSSQSMLIVVHASLIEGLYWPERAIAFLINFYAVPLSDTLHSSAKSPAISSIGNSKRSLPLSIVYQICFTIKRI